MSSRYPITKDDKLTPRTGLEIPAVILFCVTVALFLFVSAKMGTRSLGLFIVLMALVQHRQGRIPYGWEGQPPSGYLTGPLAMLVNVLVAAIGLAVFVWPEVAMGMFGPK